MSKPFKPATVWVALGSNLSEPVSQIQRAIKALAALDDTRIKAVSALYRTAPVGYVDQPDFINAAVRMETHLTPMVLLQKLNDIEAAFGRERTFQNAPRTLDLDIIDFARQVWQTERLILPHPRAHERAFVLAPLADVAAYGQLGEHGRVKDLLAGLSCAGIERLVEPEGIGT